MTLLGSARPAVTTVPDYLEPFKAGLWFSPRTFDM